MRAVLDFEPLGRLAFAGPVRTLVARTVAEVPAVLRAADAEARAGRWAVGWVAYEAAPAFEPAFRVRAPERGPLACFGVFEAPCDAPPASGAGDARVTGLAPDVERGAHAAAVESIRAALGRGDAYQVNLTFRLRGRLDGAPLALYERLRAASAARFGAFLAHDGRAIVSASPELFFAREGARVATRPMKGTARRGRFTAEDDGLATALRASEKERAENVMIADLLRNDLGRLARSGSVRVPALFQIERYPTVWQLTSTVEAEIPAAVPLDALFAALFPCGSITGAPKIAATALIAAHERSPRGSYCGAIGVVRPGGDAVFSVAIRTVEVDLETGAATYGTGGGITWGSDPAAEWDEALAKARVLEEPGTAFALLETARAEAGTIALLDRHVARLADSARYFGFPLDPSAARARLAAAAERAGPPGARLRLLAASDGALTVETTPLPVVRDAPAAVALAAEPVRSADRFLFHKTTRRAVYETRRASRPDVFDVLLRNERGELTELTTGNLVAELAGGERVTPPRTAGLLAGTQRAALLDRGELVERPLMLADLAGARRLWLVNAVRGRVEVRLTP
jgi:para-aminobenzoate synthetase / 4-amino-4-deoxychorismate lyase